MSAYIIASYDIVDPEGYEAYVPAVGPLLEKYGAEILVADFDAQCFEGEKRTANVVLRFESEQIAKDWYNDLDYAAVKQIRLDASSNGTLVLAKHFVPPGD